MAMFGKLRLIDLSVPLEDAAAHEPVPARISYATHEAEGLQQMRQLLGVRPEDLTCSGGLGWAVEGWTAGPGGDVPDSSGLRVLVVEDNADCAVTLARFLQRLGHEVEVAPDGPAAVAAAQARPPDVVLLLDLGLPGLDGWEVARRLQGHPAQRRPLLVAVTGHDEAADRRRSDEAGIDLHLDKPVDPGLLRRLLTRFRSIIR
jgi:CheY-like chemotaxis protein